jgi:prevent-host-death family protein
MSDTHDDQPLPVSAGNTGNTGNTGISPGRREAQPGARSVREPRAGRGPRAGRETRAGRGSRAREPGRPAASAEPDPRTGRAPAGTRIGIRELRQHASVYVDLAEKGYTVDVTNRGRLVARLVPVREPGSPLERLIAAGIVEPAEEPGGAAGLDPYPPVRASGERR